MEIEEKIRSRIEAVLINDARNFSEIKKMAASDEPLDADILDDERNLYQRIIHSYRSTVSEVNKLLEENIGSLSAFYRILESIKEKDDFEEICTRVVDSILQDFGADYCSLLFPESTDRTEILCLEGICEERKFLRVHSGSSMLGNRDFEIELMRLAEAEASDCLNIADVYRETRFNAVDFPSVVRSVLCLPIMLYNEAAGFLLLSHGMPGFFNDNHVRVLKILGSLIAHLRFVHAGGGLTSHGISSAAVTADAERADVYSVALMEFDMAGPYNRRILLDKDAVCRIRMRIQSALTERESILFYGERELMVFMPGVTTEQLPTRIRELKEAFHFWKDDQGPSMQSARVHFGFSVCEGDDDLSRTLEVASLVMHPEDGTDPSGLA